MSSDAGIARVLIPLTKGSGRFMSLDQLKRFYWPTLKELRIALVREGLNPVLLVEGPYASRLGAFQDVPEGKIIYWFENVDILKAKKIPGGKVCIMGNVPMSLLATGTVAQVREYCRGLLDSVGRDGGYIMRAAAVLDDAKIDNVRAMMDCTREF